MSHEQIVTEEWSEVISPKAHLFDLRLKELWHYRDLLILFVKRNFASQYKQTILGPFWHIIQPVMTTLIFLVLFNKIANIKTGTLPPMLFYMSSIAIWNFFSACLSATTSTFTSNASLFGKVYFPRLVVPVASVISNLVKFGIQFALLLAFVLYYVATGAYTVDIGWYILLLPVILFLMALMGLGTGIIISSLTTKYRDLNILIGFGVSLLMYITPVAYPLSFLEKSPYKAIVEWNPLSPLVEAFRYSLFGQGSLDPFFFGYSIVFALVCVFVGLLLFGRVERTFMDTV